MQITLAIQRVGGDGQNNLSTFILDGIISELTISSETEGSIGGCQLQFLAISECVCVSSVCHCHLVKSFLNCKHVIRSHSRPGPRYSPEPQRMQQLPQQNDLEQKIVQTGRGRGAAGRATVCASLATAIA